MSGYAGEFVSYEPTKAVCFGHQAKDRNAKAAWKSIAVFLEQRTNAVLNEHVLLRCVWPFAGPVGAFNEYRAHANAKMGTSGCGEWLFSPSRFDEALALAFDEDHWPRQSEGPACLSFSYSFRWKALLGANETMQEQASSLGVVVGGQRIFLRPHLIFPWPWDSPELHAFLQKIEDDVPFPLYPQYFKRVLPTKSGGTRVLKLAKDWRTPYS